MEKHQASEHAERMRSNMVHRNRIKNKFITGRLGAHIKHDEMKQQVQAIVDKEDTTEKKRISMKG